MAELRFDFTGTGNAFMPGGLCCNGFAVNRRFLFEAPPQALMALGKLDIDPNELETVIISHHHGDHFLGLPFLFLHWRWKGRTRPIKIVGPRSTRALATQIADAVFPGSLQMSCEVEWIEAEPGRCITLGDLTLEPVEVVHDPELSQTLGFAATLDGRRFGYTGDSILCPSVLQLARHSEVLVSECASRADRIPVHMNLVDDIPQVRAAMAPDAHLILSHISPDVDDHGLPRTTVAKDFATYRF